MDERPACAVCGGPVEDGRCRLCGRSWAVRSLHRRVVLLILLMGGTVGAFAATRALAAHLHDLRRLDGEVLFAQARAAQAQGRVLAGTQSLRRAVTTDPDHRLYRLELARALSAHGSTAEARELLQGLRETNPDDAEVTVLLARLEAADGRWDAALQHYQQTLATLWAADQLETRRVVRLELIEGLLRQGERSRVLSELLVLSADLPDDVETLVSVGQLYLQADEPRRALDHFDRALRQDADHSGALAGAGASTFAMGDYVRARGLLARVPAGDAQVSDLLVVAEIIVGGDPFAPRLPLAERRRRLGSVATHVVGVVDRCLAAQQTTGGTDTELAALRTGLAPLVPSAGDARPAAFSPDEIEEAFDLAYQAETRLAEVCAATAPMDRAIRLIAARHGLEQP